MDERVLNAALAGLLHDVGKFEQRTGNRPSRMWEKGGEVEREYKYEHAVFSGDFVERHLPDVLKPLSPPAYHHVPKSKLDRLVQLADRLSAGERDEDISRNPKQLMSIFSRIKLNDKSQLPSPRYLPLSPLSLRRKAIFATDLAERDDVADLYKALWDGEGRKAAWRGFVKEAADLKTMGGDLAEKEAYLESMLALMQRYTWCIPSAYYRNVPDVSLYDHSRMTAAIAVCLTTHSEEQVRRWLAHQDQEKPVALLVGGDFSGVQDFIYTITSKKAAQTLRGRSFYLQLLTEAILRFVLRGLGLPYTNVIYSGGGHFYLLAPLSAENALPRIQQQVTKTLLHYHGTTLYLALGWAELPANGFEIGAFTRHWNEMHDALGKAKQRRYRELSGELHQEVFKSKEHGGNEEKVCSVCGEEQEDTRLIDNQDENKGRICGLCKSFEEKIGGELPKTRYLALGLFEPKESVASKKPGTALDVLRAFDVEVSFVKGEDKEIRFDRTGLERTVVWALDDEAGNHPEVKGGIPAIFVLHYTVSRVPEIRDAAEANEINDRLRVTDQRNEDYAHPHRPKSFTHLQAQSKSIDRLGVVRMDVDDLGEIIRRGLVDEQGNNILTLSRIATLSFQMSLFFEGWVKRLCEKVDKKAGRELIYAVYAGGDDVFLIGPWEKMPLLAKRIADDFSDYVGGNGDLHVSGGISFIHGKYPVYQAADDAKDALEQAKGTSEKDAFSFLEQAWKWSDFTKVVAKFERLVTLAGKPPEVKDGLGGPQAVLQVLRRFAKDEADKVKRLKGRPVWGPWMWRGAYQFVRWAKQAGDETPLGKTLRAIHGELSANNYQDIAQWGAAARWAQLWLRKDSNSDKDDQNQ